MLASLLKQLVLFNNNIPEAVKKLHEHPRKKDGVSQMQIMERTISLTCEAYDRVFIVIDALDECEPRHKGILINFLNQMQSKSSVNIMLTSRSFPEMMVQKHFRNACNMAIAAHETDIRKYIIQEIANSDKADVIDENFKSEMIDKVSKGAQSM